MTTEHLMWANEQSCISPGAKLLAIYLANHHSDGDKMTFMLQDAAAWCGCEIEEIDGYLGELKLKSGLQVVLDDSSGDPCEMSAVVTIPEAKNGGELL